MSGHTPGPWIACDHHSGVGWRVESDAAGYPNDGWVICTDMMGPDNEANARLIAAAPDLLEALIAVLDTSGARGTYHALKYAEAVERAEALLAKTVGAA